MTVRDVETLQALLRQYQAEHAGAVSVRAGARALETSIRALLPRLRHGRGMNTAIEPTPHAI